MSIISKIKQKVTKWLWKDNPWTKAVDEIESAIMELRKGDAKKVVLKWKFKFLETPPSNKFSCIISLD